MTSPLACPQCGYVRKPTDNAPLFQCPSCGVTFAKLQKIPKSGLAEKIPRSIRIAVGVAAGVMATIATVIGTTALANHFLSQKFKEVMIVVAAMFAAYQPLLFFPALLLVTLLAIALVCGIGVTVYRFITGSTRDIHAPKNAAPTPLRD